MTLARAVTHELERISDEQHRLARRRALLTEASRKLAVGYSADVVEVELRVQGIALGENEVEPVEMLRNVGAL